MKTIKLSNSALSEILDQLDLKSSQVYEMTVGTADVCVYFYALNENGQKYKIGDDVARGMVSASIEWVPDPVA